MFAKKNMTLFILLSAIVLAAGCSSEEATRFLEEPESSAANMAAGYGDFSADITFSRKVGRKSGRPIGVGKSFAMTAKSYVHGMVDFRGIQLDRTYVVHLVWVKPDGKDVFMKYAEVVQSEFPEGGFQTVTTWLDAEDLHKVKADTLLREEPGFQLKSKLNISTKKNRIPGDYEFRVYLDRRFLIADGFQVTGDMPQLEE